MPVESSLGGLPLILGLCITAEVHQEYVLERLIRPERSGDGVSVHTGQGKRPRLTIPVKNKKKPAHRAGKIFCGFRPVPPPQYGRGGVPGRAVTLIWQPRVSGRDDHALQFDGVPVTVKYSQ